MKEVTLTGIKRKGLANWKGREWWCSRRVRIWSREHGAWWREKGQGYTDRAALAGLWTFDAAWEQTNHCGPEKGITFQAVPDKAQDERDAKDYAIEFGRYLADAARNLQAAINGGETDARNDAWRNLNLAIHEFEKRAARASV